MTKRSCQDTGQCPPRSHPWAGGWLLLSTDCCTLPADLRVLPASMADIKTCADAQCECVCGSIALSAEHDDADDAQLPLLRCASWQLAELCDPVGQQPFTWLDTVGLAVCPDASGALHGRLTLEGDAFAGFDRLHATLDLRHLPASAGTNDRFVGLVDRHGMPVLRGTFTFEALLGTGLSDRGFPREWRQTADYILVHHEALD